MTYSDYMKMKIEITEKRIQEYKKVLEKIAGREVSYEYAAERAGHTIRYVEALFNWVYQKELDTYKNNLPE